MSLLFFIEETMKLHVFTLIVFSLFIFISCGGDETPVDEPIPCETRYDCEGSMRCIDGFCSDKCVDNTDCPIGQDCVSGECKEREATADNNIVPDDAQDEEQPDDETDDEGEVDETPDEDTITETPACKEHVDCADDKYCYNELCISPFINKWTIGPIDLCLNDEDEDGDDWDLLINTDPEPYVIFSLNGDEIFTTTPGDNTHCVSFQNTHDSFFISSDKLKFEIWDEDEDIDVTGGDDYVETITFSPKVSHFRAGEMVGTGMNNMKTFSIKLIESTE